MKSARHLRSSFIGLCALAVMAVGLVGAPAASGTPTSNVQVKKSGNLPGLTVIVVAPRTVQAGEVAEFTAQWADRHGEQYGELWDWGIAGIGTVSPPACGPDDVVSGKDRGPGGSGVLRASFAWDEPGRYQVRIELTSGSCVDRTQVRTVRLTVNVVP
jgi:hypothetical protein